MAPDLQHKWEVDEAPASQPATASPSLPLAWHQHLHDLCQPLTALQCQLEVGRMLGDAHSLREALEGGLRETARMFAIVAQIRVHLQSTRAVQDEVQPKRGADHTLRAALSSKELR